MAKVKDLTGMKFGRLAVIERAGSDKHGNALWLCKCECGSTKVVSGNNLRNGTTMSCGCLHKEVSQKRVKDLIGQKFGRLTVIERAGSDKRQEALWLCECECGNMTIVVGTGLKHGHVKSCGCLHKELTKSVGRKNVKDLTGQKFGRLTVIERAENRGTKICWLCECECGNKVIVMGDSLKSHNTNSCGCLAREMIGEKSPQWKGGITPIATYLRNLNDQWFEDCKKIANYTCQLTGKRGNGKLHTHHLKAFSTIVKEAHDLYNIQIKNEIKDYTEEELKLLEEYVGSWHKDNSNAVVLSEDVHNLFHKLYGKGENTPEQFEEFKERYLAGEFKEILK